MIAELTNPFKGLRPYRREDVDTLFGRDKDMILVEDRIFSAKTTLLFAGSGVGKTSFLNAKLIPALEDQYPIVLQGEWFGKDPLSILKAACQARLRKPDEGTDPDAPPVPTGSRLKDLFSFYTTSPCILILDQFEEIFQYHTYGDYFGDFIHELSQLINSAELQVHVVLSMREEFLGDLSVFDNQIPDLFNNYYRLKHPDKKQAKLIVRKTCLLAKGSQEESSVQVHGDNLALLIDDLSKIERDVGRPGKGPPGEIQRDFVVPPYLQIVCRRWWDKQLSIRGEGENGFVYLANYEPGGARQTLRDFCREKLSGLSDEEKGIAARAFDYLITHRGAKMAYDVESLASHMKVDFGSLENVLMKLGKDGAQILREESRPDHSHWFELYHDMFSPIIYEWKEEYHKNVENMNRPTRRDALDWDRAGRDPSYLYRGQKLAHTLKLMEQNSADFDDLEREFISVSSLSRSRRLVGGLSSGVVLLLVLVCVTIFQSYQSESRHLMINALRDLPSAPRQSLRSALEVSKRRFSDAKLRRDLESTFRRSLYELRAGEVWSQELEGKASARAWAPDSPYLITAEWDAIRIWNAESGKALFREIESPGIVGSVALSPDGGQAAMTVPSGGEVYLWDVASQDPRLLTKFSTSLGSLSFTPDGEYLAISAKDANVQLWEVESGVEKAVFEWNAALVESMDFTGDGARLATAGKGAGVVLWNVETGAEVEALDTYALTERMNAVAFSPGGERLATASDDGTATLWALQERALLQTFRHDGPVKGVAFFPGKGFRAEGTPPGWETSSGGDYLVTVTADCTVRIWNVNVPAASGLLYRKAPDAQADWCSLSPDGRRLAVGASGNLRMLDLIVEDVTTLVGHQGEIYSVAFSHQGDYLATASRDSTIRVWKLVTPPVWRSLEGHSGQVRTVAFHPGDRLLASGGEDGRVILWQWSETPVVMHVLNEEDEGSASVRRVLFGPKGDLLAAVSWDGRLRIWDSGSRKLLHTLGETETDPIHAGAFSPEGGLLATAGDHQVALWNLNTYDEPVRTFDDSGEDPILDLAFSPDGRRLVTADGSMLKVWAVRTGKLLRSLEVPGSAKRIAFGPTGRRWVTCGLEGALVWDTASDLDPYRLPGRVNDFAFRSDGAFLATAGADGIVRLETWPLKSLADLAEDRLKYFNRAEPE